MVDIIFDSSYIYINLYKAEDRLPWILRFPPEDNQRNEEADLVNEDSHALPRSCPCAPLDLDTPKRHSKTDLSETVQ